jgi:pSer/pThr/pTyr-binding forkhead associated (FHA) protein
MWKAIIEDPEGQRVDVTLKADEYPFGRGPQNKVRLTDRNVSRRHARLVRLGTSFVLEDLESFNGTYVNGDPVVRPGPLAARRPHPDRRLPHPHPPGRDRAHARAP